MKTIRKIGEVWKDPDPFVKSKPWYVRFPDHIEAFTTKKQAQRIGATVATIHEARL